MNYQLVALAREIVNARADYREVNFVHQVEQTLNKPNVKVSRQDDNGQGKMVFTIPKHPKNGIFQTIQSLTQIGFKPCLDDEGTVYRHQKHNGHNIRVDQDQDKITVTYCYPL